MIAKTIERVAKCVYTNPWGYEVHACKLYDKGSKRQEIGILIQSPKDGTLSDIIRIKKSQFVNMNLFNFLLDMEGDFDKADIDAVKVQVLAQLKELPERDSSTKVPIEEVYKDLCEYVEGNEKEDIISISDGYCNIAADEFKKILNESDYGYTKLELQKLFKVLGLLRVNNGRVYDFAMTDKYGSQYRTISFKYISSREVA